MGIKYVFSWESTCIHITSLHGFVTLHIPTRMITLPMTYICWQLWCKGGYFLLWRNQLSSQFMNLLGMRANKYLYHQLVLFYSIESWFEHKTFQQGKLLAYLSPMFKQKGWHLKFYEGMCIICVCVCMCVLGGGVYIHPTIMASLLYCHFPDLVLSCYCGYVNNWNCRKIHWNFPLKP